jgi:hypothetical protein
MMHALPYSSSQRCQPKVAIVFYVGGITRTLSIYSYSLATFNLRING